MKIKEETKKTYRQPTLNVYGKLKDLTAGGSGKSNEGKDTNDFTKRP